MRLDVRGRRASDTERDRRAARAVGRGGGRTELSGSPSPRWPMSVKRVTTERGLDARDFALVAYGGAGPLHAMLVARELGIRQRHHPERARTFLGLRHAGRRPAPRLRAHLFVPLARRPSSSSKRSSRAWSSGAGRTSRSRRAPTRRRDRARRRHALCRAGALRHRRHAARSIFAQSDRAGDQDAVRRRARAALRLRPRRRAGGDREPALRRDRRIAEARARARSPRGECATRPRRAQRHAQGLFRLSAGFVRHSGLHARQATGGNRIAGPALVEEYASTTVVLPGDASASTHSAISSISSGRIMNHE